MQQILRLNVAKTSLQNPAIQQRIYTNIPFPTHQKQCLQSISVYTETNGAAVDAAETGPADAVGTDAATVEHGCCGGSFG